MKRKERKSPPLKTWGFLKEVNNSYNADIMQGMADGKPVIMATAMVPPQIGAGFDAVYIAGEWYGSICGFVREISFCETAERCGFPHELCSYARMTLGSMIEDRSFIGQYPKPAAVLGQEGLCVVQAKWFESLARYHNAPFFTLDVALVPFQDLKNWGEEAVRDAVDYYAVQAGNCLEFLEWSLGQKVNEEKLIDATINMHRNEVLWDDLMRMWRKKPSPITIRNLFTFENLIIALPTRPSAGDVLEAVIEELHERVEKGVSGLEDEQIRLLWQAQPGWYTLGVLKYFESHGATFVGSPYLETWGHDLRYEWCKDTTPTWFKEWKEPANIDECLWEISKGIVAMHCRPRLDAGIEAIKRLAVEAEADGAVWHAVRGCKGVSYGELGEKLTLREELGLPGMMLEGSPADPRDFSEGPAKRQIRIFLEQVSRIQKRKSFKTRKSAVTVAAN